MKNLKQYFAKAKKIAGKNRALVTLENCLIKDGMLYVTDLEMYYRFKIPVSKDLTCLINFRILNDYLAKVKTFPSIRVEGTSVFIDNLKLPNGDIEDFPLFPEATTGETHLKGEDLEILNNLLPFVSKDDLRPAMQGVFVSNDKAAATDAHKLKWSKIDLDNFSGIIPSKVLPFMFPGYISCWCDKEDGMKRVYLVDHSQELMFRLIDAKFPDYTVVIPQKNPYKVRIDKELLLNALSKVSHTCNKITNAITFTFNGAVKLETEDLDLGIESNESIPYISSNVVEDLRIGFNGKYLETILKSYSEDVVTLELDNPNRCVVINDSALLMPVMI